MRAAPRLSVLVAGIIVGFSVETAGTQSKDIDNPTPLTTNALKGDMSEPGNTYYSFLAGPGLVTATIFMEAPGPFTIGKSADAQLLSPNLAKSLCTATAAAEMGGTDSKVCSVTLPTEQRLILRLGFRDGCKTCTYRVRIEGMRGAGAAAVPAPATTQSSTPAATQPCTPPAASGARLMVVRLKDGTTTQIDLSKVAEITYK